MNNGNSSKITKFRKKFSFKNIIKIICDFFWKLIKEWVIRIIQKHMLLMAAINRVGKAFRIYKKKFKSVLKFKRNFNMLKNLVLIFYYTFLVFCSLISEILFLTNLLDYLIQWINLIALLMNESLFITRIVYLLYLLFLGIFGILVGFLLGLYNPENKINAFLLLLLLKIIYNFNNRFENVLLEYLETKTVEPFSKFSVKSIEPIDPRPLQITLKKIDRIPLPVLIIEDPFITIETQVLWEEPYKFQLFYFYQNVTEIVKH